MQASDNVFKFRKWMFRIAVILASLFALLGAFILVMQSSWGRQKIVSLLSATVQESGWSVKIDTTAGSLPHKIVLNHVTLQSPEGDLATVQSIETEISLIHLLKKEIYFTQFYADQIQWTPGKEFSKGFEEKNRNPGLPWGIHFSDMRLSHVLIPNLPKTVNITGQIKIGRNNRMALAHLSAKITEQEENYCNIDLWVHPNRQTNLKLDASMTTRELFPDYPIEAQGNIHLDAKGAWEAFSSLITNDATHSSIDGKINGSIQIDKIEAIDLAKHLVEGSWNFSSSIARLSNQEIRLFNISATGDQIQTSGHLALLPDGQLQEGSILLSINDLRKAAIPNLSGSILADFNMTNWNAGTIILRSPLVEWKNGKAQNLFATLRAEKTIENWSGNLDLKASYLEHEWTAKGDLIWIIGDSLKIDELLIHSDLAEIVGNVEIDSNQLLVGELRTQIPNLHNFDIPIYGALDTTIRLNMDETQKNPDQMVEIDAKAIDLFYNDLQIEKGFFYADLTGSLDHLSGHVYCELQQSQYKSLFIDTAIIETESADDTWPLSFRAEGTWREPFDLIFNGFWQTKASHLFLHLQDLTGSLFSQPLTLTSHSNIEIGSDTLMIDDFSIWIGDADMHSSIQHLPNQTNAQLSLHRIPLDFLSLNPLNLSVSGRVDLDATIAEKNGAAQGKLNGALFDVQIADISGGEPIRAKGQIAAELNHHRLIGNADLEVNQKPLFSISADLPMNLTIYPFQPELLLDPEASARITLNGQIEELLDFFNLGPNRVEGNCEIDLVLSNNLASPTIHGYGKLKNGYYENYYSGFQLQNVSAEIIGDNHSLILRSFTGQDSQNKGKISLTGRLRALWKEKFPFRFDGEFSRLNVAEMDWMRAEAGGVVQISGDIDGAHISAQAAIIESDLSIPETLPPQLPNLQVNYINTPKPVAIEMANMARPKSYPVFLDLHIYAPDGVFVSGRGLSSEWKGNFQLGGTFTDIEAKGKLELIEGEFLFSGRGFKLTEGAITFSGKAHEMPWISLAGQMREKDIDILAQLRGPLNSPELAFQSIPPLPMGSILSQLLFGQNLAEINALQAAKIVNSLATFSPNNTIFSNTRRSLGIDRLRIIATPTSDEGGESVALQVGKYVTRGILVSVSQGFEAGSTNLSIEVDLANGFVFQAESQQEQEQGKFTIKWNLNY